MTRYCPYCGTEIEPDQAQEGQVPGTIVCPVCQQELDRDQALEPAEPPPPAVGPGPAGEDSPQYETQPPPPPQPPSPPVRVPDPADSPAWEGEGGLVNRFWRTTWQVLLHPVRTFSAPAQPGYAPSLSYAIIMGTLGGAVQALWSAAFSGGAVDRDAIWQVIFMPLIVLVGLYISCAVLHAFLWILRGAGGGYRASFRVMAYGEAASIWLLVPGIGLLVAMVWTLVVMIGGLAAVHNTGRGRVVLALILPIFGFFFLAILLGMAAVVGMLFSSLLPIGGLGL